MAKIYYPGERAQSGQWRDGDAGPAAFRRMKTFVPLTELCAGWATHYTARNRLQEGLRGRMPTLKRNICE